MIAPTHLGGCSSPSCHGCNLSVSPWLKTKGELITVICHPVTSQKKGILMPFTLFLRAHFPPGLSDKKTFWFFFYRGYSWRKIKAEQTKETWPAHSPNDRKSPPCSLSCRVQQSSAWIFKHTNREVGPGHFCHVSGERIRGNCLKLHQGRFRLHVFKKKKKNHWKNGLALK